MVVAQGGAAVEIKAYPTHHQFYLGNTFLLSQSFIKVLPQILLENARNGQIDILRINGLHLQQSNFYFTK
jgi:hypothetical protein